MKPNQGEIGVKEAQIGLSVLVCMLVGLGYVMIQRIGGVWDPPTVEIRAASSSSGSDSGSETYHQVPENLEPTIVMPDVQPYPFAKENSSSPQAVYSTPDQTQSEALTTFSATTNRSLQNNHFNNAPNRLYPSESTLPLKIKPIANQPDRSKDFIEMATRGRKLSQRKKTAAPFQVSPASHTDLENQTSNIKPASHPSKISSPNLAGKRYDNSSSELTEAPLFVAEKQKPTPPVLKPVEKKVKPLASVSAPDSKKQPAHKEGRYLAKQGEKLNAIALHLYGDRRWSQALYEHNRPALTDPFEIKKETELYVPTTTQLMQWYPTRCK